MTGKAKEYFDLWEADRGNMDQAKSYEELLTKSRTTQEGESWIVQRKRRCNTEVNPWTL